MQDCYLKNLGKKLSLKEVANIFEVEISTVKRYPNRYGGVRMGRQILFFEIPVSNTIWGQYAIQKDKDYEKTGKDPGVGRPGDDRGKAILTDFCHEKRGKVLGRKLQKKGEKSRKTEVGNTQDPHNLLAS